MISKTIGFFWVHDIFRQTQMEMQAPFGNLQAGPTSYDEVTAFAQKLTVLRPARRAYAIGKAMAAVASMSNPAGLHHGEVRDVEVPIKSL